jgi:hypothetical protein
MDAMTNAPTLGVVDDYADLVAVLRRRVDELGISREVLDDLAGLQYGYSSKTLGTRSMRVLGKYSLGLMLKALGLQLVVQVNESQMAKIRNRLVQRDQAQVRIDTRPSSITPDYSMKIRFFQSLGIAGAKTKNAKTPPEVRRQHALKAIQTRWRKARAPA